jgi:hypothetical protein
MNTGYAWSKVSSNYSSVNIVKKNLLSVIPLNQNSVPVADRDVLQIRIVKKMSYYRIAGILYFPRVRAETHI